MTKPPSDTTVAEYERALEDAGYGDAQRQQYIEGSGDAEYAACQWDEMVVPAAEAAGVIPARPVEPITPAEQASQDARARASSEYWQQHPVEQGGWDPLGDPDPVKEGEFQKFVEDRVSAILREPAPEIERDLDDDLDL